MSEPSAGWLEGREHVLPVRIYYEDTDFTGVVYHANYLRYFERGRSEFFRVAGISHSALLQLAEPMAFSIVRIELDYRRAARVDDALLVRTTYDTVKGPRLMVSQRITRGQELIAEAQVQAVCIDLKGRAKKPPQGMVDLLRPYFAAP
jgi:acyl-CoA thioester hydrolase